MEISPKMIKTASVLLVLLIVVLSIALLAEQKEPSETSLFVVDTATGTTTGQDIVKAPVTHIDPADSGTYVSASSAFTLDLVNDETHSARFTSREESGDVLQAGVWETKEDGSVFVSLFNRGSEGQPPVYLHFKKNGEKLVLDSDGTTADIDALTLTRSAS